MNIGIVGLGKIGRGLALQAVERGHRVVGFDTDAEVAHAMEPDGLVAAATIAELLQSLDGPRRVVIVLVPQGDPVQQVLDELRPLVHAGDIVIDGGNSHWSDSVRHHGEIATSGASFLDMGTSGGVRGARNGACFMVGGDRDAFEFVRPLLTDLADHPDAVTHVGPPGAGHFVKLVHNAVEFGMVQAFGEGLEMLSRSGYDLDIPLVLRNWEHGSVVRSWLVELLREQLGREQAFDSLATRVEDTGEVKWVINWALDEDIPAPVTTAAQTALMQYRDPESIAARGVALMRHGYGEHPLHRR